MAEGTTDIRKPFVEFAGSNGNYYADVLLNIQKATLGAFHLNLAALLGGFVWAALRGNWIPLRTGLRLGPGCRRQCRAGLQVFKGGGRLFGQGLPGRTLPGLVGNPHHCCRCGILLPAGSCFPGWPTASMRGNSKDGGWTGPSTAGSDRRDCCSPGWSLCSSFRF